jgi:hypothetical protein
MNTLEIFLRCPNLFASSHHRRGNQHIEAHNCAPVAGGQTTGNPRMTFNPHMRIGNFYGSTYALNEYKLEELEVNHDGAEVMYSAKYSNNITRYNQSWNASAADRALLYYYERKAFIVNKLLQQVSSYMSSDEHRTNLEPTALDENTAQAFIRAEEGLRAILQSLSGTGRNLPLLNGNTATIETLPRYGPIQTMYAGEERPLYIGPNKKTKNELSVNRVKLKDFLVRYAHDTTAGDFSIQLSEAAELGFQGTIMNGRNTHRASCQVPMEHTGLHLRLVGPQAGQRDASQDEVSHTNLQIFSGGTQKRKARGAYQGPYQGLKDLVLRGKNVLTYKMPTGNSNAVITLPTEYDSLQTVQAATTMPVGRSSNGVQIALSLEAFKEIFQRPELDVKPTRIGHLLFYRIGEATVHVPFAQTLSDLILPSMAQVMVSVKAPTVTSSTDEYVGGESCRGDCDDSPTVSEPLAPGLYLVEREVLCGRGHDTGRGEYTAGFGDYVNERMSTMSLLSKLQVAFDNTRISSVGSGETMASDFDFDEIAFSGLGRL